MKRNKIDNIMTKIIMIGFIRNQFLYYHNSQITINAYNILFPYFEYIF